MADARGGCHEAILTKVVNDVVVQRTMPSYCLPLPLSVNQKSRAIRDKRGEGVGHAPKDLFMHMLVHDSSLVCCLAASACAGYKCTDQWADDGCRPVAGGGRVRPNTSLRIKTKS